ncbi:pyrroline-5-carboxylate reductase [bacterium (Candidatus Blackallbacteria) CG17_big_fil_post_rev_8_21_14_2_50_48_46]|uniref:Pyrroline-5-carboxylate reductase n=1 Tax=bacterium (Candidatus Blackallbacteria) CG17_big_fil_post_rev_8_21_14_2_50_48_46 TaxID=2014261 RepID=A0A2M7G3N5_9BACT|nr:MAG: pyrroline-5-carboxylate reductase [bacterium (Candidatus Blackallbacteria) CG18_big_fil_WC_8_21_14_2_50_49_26]PIW16072.1 MAG: pyrroline-5-carboxylate reductase [bacterium (Candidatus Blackallbacteria) CG17_big_fil_post_rev_8_21_14_2_50_48_46]PIW50484.1 MAG: pyrroline-5-carboxylate reductase [bacterium (Candidatus Blackallbacteria) CG13_big_fil_rev_8_21_14_2_50_49_14]
MAIRFAVIGGGVMGEVLSRAVTSAQVFSPEEVLVLDPNPNKLRKLHQEIGVQTTTQLSDLAQAEILLLAVKPDNVSKVLSGLGAFTLPANLLLISIVAGVSIEGLARWLPAETAIIRVMTNTPCLVNAGMSVLATNSQVQEAQLELTRTIFTAVGECLILPEKYLDAVTGLSGSGPGFVFLIVDALIEAGVLQGLPRATSRQLVLQTLLGSAQLIQETDRHPAQLRDMVTSPGGTTIAGIQVMEEYKIRATLLKTVETATRRSRELGERYKESSQ